MYWLHNIMLLSQAHYVISWPIIATCTHTFMSKFQSEERETREWPASLYCKEIPPKYYITVTLTHIGQNLVT